MQTFLVTWNPDKWKWTNLDSQWWEVQEKGHFQEPWTCRTKAVNEGDRIFLLKQGKRNRGIIASGRALGTSEPGTHYNDASKSSRYVNVRWDTLLHPDRQKILSRDRLNAPKLRKMWWDTAASGVLIPEEVADELEVIWAPFKRENGQETFVHPEELQSHDVFWEGALKIVSVNVYERNPKARASCINHHGTTCSVCSFDFASVYGPAGDGFIHVHHVLPISSIGKSYVLDPIEDLRPVCPNCHAMLHRTEPPMAIAKLRSRIARRLARVKKG